MEITGQQLRVGKDQKVYVHRLASEEDANVSFDRVLLISNNGAITVGAPAIDEASVEAGVLKHVRGNKVITFKKRRRRGYKVKNGHHQLFTQIVIKDIVAE